MPTAIWLPMDKLYSTAQRYILEHNVLCLATCSDNAPWVAPVFYTVFDAKLLFLSAPHTLHCKNIAHNPSVAGSIQEDYQDWQHIKGFQLHGEVSQLEASTVPAAIDAYSQKFPVTGEHAPPEIAKALDRIHWYALSIASIFFIDNSKGLGHRDELDPTRLLQI